MDLDLGHLKRAKSDIGEELCGSRASEPDGTLVFCGGFLTGKVGVLVLEDFVETVLEHSLEGVSNEGGSETFPETLATFLSNDGTETGDETLEFSRVDL